MTFQRHESEHQDMELVAIFEQRSCAEAARTALLGAGLPADAIAMAGAQDHGAVTIVVQPQTAKQRTTALEALQASGPVEITATGVPSRRELNHTALTRADMVASGTPTLVVASEPRSEPVAAPAAGTTYTHGVPEQVVRSMTAEEQVLGQAPSTGHRST